MAKLKAKTRNEAASIARSRGLVDEYIPTRTGFAANVQRLVYHAATGRGFNVVYGSERAAAPC